MTIQTFASGIQTGTASEVFVSSPNIAGQFRMYLDTSNMTTGTYTEVRRYKMVASGGTARVIDVTPIQGFQPVAKQIYDSEIIINDLAETNGSRFSNDSRKQTQRHRNEGGCQRQDWFLAFLAAILQFDWQYLRDAYQCLERYKSCNRWKRHWFSPG